VAVTNQQRAVKEKMIAAKTLVDSLGKSIMQL
jgi:hypothetical protein